LELNVNFVIDDNTECQIDAFNLECGFVSLNYIRQNVFVADFAYLGNFQYLVLVRLFNDYLTGYADKDTVLTGADNSDFRNSLAEIKVYVQGVQWDAMTIKVPGEVLSTNSQGEYIWLALCMNGSVGPVSAVPIAEYSFIPSGNMLTNSTFCGQQSSYQET